MRTESLVRLLPTAFATFVLIASAASGAPKAKKTAAPAPDLIESPAYIQAETARLIAPKDAVSTRDVRVVLVTTVPHNATCYEPSAEVDHESTFSHVISARARALLDGNCAPRRSRWDFQTLELGRLEPGTHTIRIEDAVTPVEPLTVVVRDGALATVSPGSVAKPTEAVH